MKFGMRMPSLKRRFAARTSLKRQVRHRLGWKAPRGFGWLTNPKRAAYNRVYNRTTFGLEDLFRSTKARKARATMRKGASSDTTNVGWWIVAGVVLLLVLGATG